MQYLFNNIKVNVQEKDNPPIMTDLLAKFIVKDMNEWTGVNADLIITDPPFGINFTGKNTNYHRNVDNVVDGYVEWTISEYGEKIQQLLECITRNLKKMARRWSFQDGITVILITIGL